MQRRHFLRDSGVSVWVGMGLGAGVFTEAWGHTTLAQIWRREGGVLMLRHTATEPGVGDPPEFVLGQCHTQRNLSEQGRQAARVLGEWVRAQRLQPDAVLSSQWCRCQDTARLAFGGFEDWTPLNSTFAGQGDAASQTRAMQARLQGLAVGRREVWVTHQVNMTAMTQAYPEMGEAFLLDRQSRLLARGRVA